MNTEAIDMNLQKEERFVGAFPCDMVPEVVKYEYSIIINVDSKTQEGSHWVALGIRGDNAYFCDSFGRRFDNFSFPELFINSINKLCQGKQVHFNETILQSFSATTCGEYAIYFIKMFHSGKTFKQMFSRFTENLNQNDKLIMKIF